MMLNVWGWCGACRRRLIRWTGESVAKGTAMPAEAAKAMQRSLLATRLSFWLSFPMLFFMGAASHYMMFRRVVMPVRLPSRCYNFGLMMPVKICAGILRFPRVQPRRHPFPCST